MNHALLGALGAAVLILSGMPARASDAGLDRVLDRRVRAVQAIARHPIVVDAVRARNREPLTRDLISQRDQQWRNGDLDATALDALLDPEVSAYLRAKVQSNESVYSEAILTDAQGANIACFPVTSDYWQGDEEKFVSAYDGGSGAVYRGPIQFDESTQLETVQIAVPVLDDSQAIGVLIVGVRLSYAEAAAGD